MFGTPEFWKIFSFLKGDNVPDLDSNLKIRAQAEKVKAALLFENTLDQICYSTNDYNRLRNFLIDWYAAHRTITSVGKDLSDPFSIPSDHLDELFRSFGFEYSNEIESFVSKANLSLNLVDLYKVKGTPTSLIRALYFYGIQDLDLVEYWLEKDEDGQLTFRSDRVNKVLPGGYDIPIPSIEYATMTHADPHWLLSKEDIEKLIAVNNIGIPSKSPYFSLRPKYSMHRLKLPLSVMLLRIQDAYYHWVETGELPELTFPIYRLNYTVSILELYLATIYVFNAHYLRFTTTDDTRFICYDGPSVSTADIIAEFEEVNRQPFTREEREELLKIYQRDFTRHVDTNFIKDSATAGEVLQQINPDLHHSLTSYLQAGEGLIVLRYLLRAVVGWIKSELGDDYPDIAITAIGLETIPYIFDVINFFKPYHARLSTVDIAFILDSPLLDSVLVSDKLTIDIIQTIVDFTTCNGVPCCHDGTTCNLYSRETYDCGSYYDAGASCDKDNFHTEITQINESRWTCPSDSTASFVDSGDFPPEIHPHMQESVSNVLWQDGRWNEFDDGSCFDNFGGRDIVHIYIKEIPILSIIHYDTTSSLNFTIFEGEIIPSQTIDVWNTSDYDNIEMYFTITSDVPWITANPPNSVVVSEPDQVIQTVEILFNSSILSYGNYNPVISINSFTGINSPVQIPVDITVLKNPEIAVDSTGFNIMSVYGEDNTSILKFNIWNAGDGTLNFNISESHPWFTCNPTSGTSSGELNEIEVSFNTSELPVGDHTGTIIIGSNNAINAPVNIPISNIVYMKYPPEIATDTTALIVYADMTSTLELTSFNMWNNGDDDLIYNIEIQDGTNVPWLSIVSETQGTVGSDPITINIEVNPFEKWFGPHYANIVITSPNAINSPYILPFVLNINWDDESQIQMSGMLAEVEHTNFADRGTHISNMGVEVEHTIGEDALRISNIMVEVEHVPPSKLVVPSIYTEVEFIESNKDVLVSQMSIQAEVITDVKYGYFYPAAGGDDGYSLSDWSGFNNDENDFYHSQNYNNFIRFTNINIPKDSLIIYASVVFTCRVSNTNSSVTTARYYFHNSDNAVAPTDASEFETMEGNLVGSGTNITFIGVSINHIYPKNLIKEDLQYIVNKAGWTSGNSVLLVGLGQTSFPQLRRFSSFDYDGGSQKPVLIVNWKEIT